MKASSAITLVVLLLSMTSLATAGGGEKGYLTRPEDGPDPDAKGFIKAKDRSGVDKLMVKLTKVDRGETFGLYIQKEEDSEEFELFGEIEVPGRSPRNSKGGGAGKWKVNTKQGDELPLQAETAADLVGLTVEVRNEEGETVLKGAFPGVGNSKKQGKKKERAELEVPEGDDPVEENADGYVQAGIEFLKVLVQNVSAGTYDVFLANDSDEMVAVGELDVAEDGGDGIWMVNTKRGDPLPFDVDSIEELVLRDVEIRDSEDRVVLKGTVPEFWIGGKLGEGPKSGHSLRIIATDAPFPFDDVESAIVTVHRIEIRPDDGPFETLIGWENGRDLDLVKLRNGVTEILFAGNPDPGDYDALRIIVTAKEITIKKGDDVETYDDFKVPSGEQTGIKVFIDPAVEVTSELTRDVILDFDLAKSFVVQGNPNTPAGIKGFHFKPVIRAVNKTVAGTLTFRVMSDDGTPGDRSDDFYLNNAAYKVIDTTADPDEVVASGASGPDPDDARVDGYVFHPGVVAGSFKLEVAFRDHDTHAQRLTIDAGNLSDEGTIVLAATAAYVKGTIDTEIETKDGKTLIFVVADATVEGTVKGDDTATASDTSNSLGGYALTSLGFSTYEVEVTKTGYEDGTGESQAWTPGDPTAKDLDFTLVPETADVEGTVTDESGNAVEGATVQAVIDYAGEDEVIAEATTDVDGNYTLSDLPTASYEICAEHEDGGTTLTGSAELDHTGGGSAATVDLTVE
jgi:hypothetical protein